MPALIFDCDGVLSDTERYGHLPAFNQTFAKFNLPVRWSEEDYAEKLRIGGGKERMRSILTAEFIKAAGLPTDERSLHDKVAQWHKYKTQLYVEAVENGRLPARPGVARVAKEARDAGWQLAVASTSAERSVRAVLGHVMGHELASSFEVFAGDVVHEKKPSPAIYELTLEELRVDRSDAVVIEDSRNGLLAATGAKLKCVVTVNGYTVNESFDEAALVVTDLGDPGGRPMRVLANRSSAEPAVYVTLADLQAVLYGI